MARQRTSPAEDMVILVSKLPWWIGLSLALVSYVILHMIASRPIMPKVVTPGQMGDAVTSGLLTTLAMFGQYVLPCLFAFGAILSAIAAARQKKLYNHTAARAGVSALNEMSWDEFEVLVGEHFRRRGFQVIRHGGNGPDGGVDLVLRNKGETYFVQCKQWKAYKVGVQPVRELYGIMASRGAAGGYVVTSGTYTDEARDFARGLNVELIDGVQLRQMIDNVRSAAVNTVQHEIFTQSSPLCPKCGSGMKRRVARQGENTGREFWGCSTFPKCHATLPLEDTAADKPTAPASVPLTTPAVMGTRVCPLCGRELVLRQFQSGPKSGQQFYGCLACKKGWPVDDCPTGFTNIRASDEIRRPAKRPKMERASAEDS